MTRVSVADLLGGRAALHAISALVGATVIQSVLTVVSMLLVQGRDHEYGAPMPVGEYAGGVVVGGPLTFSPSLFVVDIGITAAILYALARWSGLIGVGLATLAASVYLGAVVLAIAYDRRIPIGPNGLPIPMTGAADPLILWLDTMFWSAVAAGVVPLLRRVARGRRR